MSAFCAENMMAVGAAADDDDGMPPLVDMPPLVENPYPAMTFTFGTNFTPITFGSEAMGTEVAPGYAEDADGEVTACSPPDSPLLCAARPSHAKKRDASYIPRPPNAFILFRSSFVRAQHVPGKVEGSHSALSKIIGKYWKSLPRDEREKWEAKAIVAQTEHRKKYPDWRFRPSTNALALAKVKDGPKRRMKKGRGEAEKEIQDRETRCAKIAEMLASGKKGVDLEAAIKEYDSVSGKGSVKKTGKPAVRGKRAAAATKRPVDTQSSVHHSESKAGGGVMTRRATVDCMQDAQFKVPLTAMFKRSSSEPALHAPLPNSAPSDVPPAYERRLSVDYGCAPMLHSPFDTSAVRHEALPRVGGHDINFPNACREAAAQDGVAAMPQPFDAFAAALDTQQYTHAAAQFSNGLMHSPSEGSYYSPSLPAFEPDSDGLMSPIQSPLPDAFDLHREGEIADGAGKFFAYGCRPNTPFRSSYSTLDNWAGKAGVLLDHAVPALSLPVLGGPPLVYDADAVGIMRGAFEEASSALYSDWNDAAAAALTDPNYVYQRASDRLPKAFFGRDSHFGTAPYGLYDQQRFPAYAYDRSSGFAVDGVAQFRAPALDMSTSR